MIARFNGRENCAGRTLPWPRAVAVCLFFLVATSAPATDAAAPFLGTNSPALPPLPSSTSVVFSLFRVLGALALVLAVFFAGVWLFRNWQRTLVHRGQSPKLNILETKALGQRHALVVVGYEQQRFLVASSPAGVTMLATLPEGSPVVAEIKSTGTPTFTESLRLALSNTLSPSTPSPAGHCEGEAGRGRGSILQGKK